MAVNTSGVIDSVNENVSWIYAPYLRRQQWVPYLSIYGIYSPLATILGIVGNVLCFIGIYPKIKERIVFVQQAAVILTDLLVTIFNYSYSLGLILGTRQLEGFHFIRKVGPLMWYFAHCSVPLALTFMLVNQFLLVGTSLDRVFALYKPILYKISNHFHRSFLIIVVSYTIGIVVVFYQYFRFDIIWEPENEVYFMVTNEEHKNSTYNKVSGVIYLVLNLSSLVMIWILIPMIIVKYRKTQKEKKERQKEKNKKNDNQSVDENLLTVLLIAEGVIQILGGMSLAIYYGIYYFASSGTLKNIVLGKFVFCLDFMTIFQSTWNFLFYMIMSKSFRQSLQKQLGFQTATVAPMPASNKGTGRAGQTL